MSTGLLLYEDTKVMEYLLSVYGIPKMQFDQAIGLVGNDGKLVGGILLQSWNGHNIECSYYGKRTLTPGIIRSLGRILLSTFKVSRVTVTVSRRHKYLMRALRKLGFVLEGTQRRFYGQADTVRNTGVRFVMFRERIEELAKLQWQATG